MTKERLVHVPPSHVIRNPDNPRIYFRPEELNSLMTSIDAHGIQVPITVYESGSRFVLIDGERRWRCANKLGLKSIPAVVKDKPSPLENLLLMYNIHALREQWDYLTIATSLERVISLFQEEKDLRPTEKQLSKATGLTIGQVRRCRLIIELPQKYKKLLMKELYLPKHQQSLSEDFFLEMEKALKAVVKNVDGYKPRLNEIRDVLIEKYRHKSIAAVTEFRLLTKIATSVRTLGVDEKQAKHALSRIFDRNSVGIKKVFESTVGFEYNERKASVYTDHLIKILQSWIDDGNESRNRDANLDKKLRQLHKQLSRLFAEDNK